MARRLVTLAAEVEAALHLLLQLRIQPPRLRWRAAPALLRRCHLRRRLRPLGQDSLLHAAGLLQEGKERSTVEAHRTAATAGLTQMIRRGRLLGAVPPVQLTMRHTPWSRSVGRMSTASTMSSTAFAVRIPAARRREQPPQSEYLDQRRRPSEKPWSACTITAVERERRRSSRASSRRPI